MTGFSEASFLQRPEVLTSVPRTDASPLRSTQAGDLEALARQFVRDGADALDDEALLCLLFGLVMPDLADPAGLARAALARTGSFAAFLAADERTLRAEPGLGTHAIAAARLLHDAALRFARSGLGRRRVLDDRVRLEAYLAAVLGRERIEQFRVLFLDPEGLLLADEAQARGTVNHTPVYPREVVRRALELDAAAIILVHNHPSGDPTPSADDLEMTRQVLGAAALLGVAVRDHLIVGNGRTLSFRDEGLLG